MSKLKVGDRVAVYDSALFRLKVKIEQADPNTGRVSFFHDGHFYWVHPKQCRKLKPKKRREIWLSESTLEWVKNTVGAYKTTEDDKAQLVRFVEAPEKKK